jgi:hypothetical protein
MVKVLVNEACVGEDTVASNNELGIVVRQAVHKPTWFLPTIPIYKC